MANCCGEYEGVLTEISYTALYQDEESKIGRPLKVLFDRMVNINHKTGDGNKVINAESNNAHRIQSD